MIKINRDSITGVNMTLHYVKEPLGKALTLWVMLILYQSRMTRAD